MVDPKLNIKADSTYDWIQNTFCTAKLSMLRGFTKGVSVDVLYLYKHDILEYNLPYVQSDFMGNPGPTKYCTLFG